MAASVEGGAGKTPAAHVPTPSTSRRASAGSIKLTLTSLLIAFAFTLVFRGFVLEAFIIPTGSMAPTLLGTHWRIDSPASGLSWAVNSRIPPIELDDGTRVVEASDPVSRAALESHVTAPAPGDRILVLKWPFALRDPSRWDVVVFKNPEIPRENYIKRLVGLPGEDVWLVDGDVFVRNQASRRHGAGMSSETAGAIERRKSDGTGGDGAWRIVRKPERVQRALWRPVWSSEFAWREGILHGEVGTDQPSAYDALPPSSTALDPESMESDADDPAHDDESRSGRAQSSSPWTGDGWVWINDGRSLMSRPGAGALVWDSVNWPIVDWTPYNEARAPGARDARRFYPVNDVRVRFVVDARGPMRAAIRVHAQGREWIVVLQRSDSVDTFGLWDAAAEAAGATNEHARWIAGEAWGSDEGPMQDPPFGVELALVDQSIEGWINGHRVWTFLLPLDPRERLLRATGRGAEEIDALLSVANDPSTRGNPLADPTLFTPPEISIEFSGPVTLHRLGVDRDIYYRPGVMETDPRIPARGTHPRNIAHLSGDRGARGEFFVLGDNSGASRDGRLWDSVNPWIAHEIDANEGVVPRALLLGKAFFVYFPAPHEVRVGGRDRRLVPDFGRMRWIR